MNTGLKGRICAIGMTSVLFTGALMMPPASAATADPTRTASEAAVVEGSKGVVTGKVPVRFKNSLVVLEVIEGKQRQQVGMTTSNKDGRVSLKVQLGAGKDLKARWRVVKNKKTQWTSPAFALVNDSGKTKHTNSAGAFQVFKHAQPSGGTVKPQPRLSEAKNGLTARSAGGVVGDVAEGVGEDAVKSTGQMLEDLAGDSVYGLVADGIGMLFSNLLGGNTTQQIAALTQQMQQDFAQVDSQLQSIETSLSALSGQVSTLQEQVIQANASAASASCNVLLSEANGYVNSIENAYGNYQLVLTPSWMQANLTNTTGKQSIQTVGNQIFGAGSGTPSFASGVIGLQNSVSSLAALLNQGGASGTSGLITACSGAVSAGVSASLTGNTSSTVVPAGAVEASYYSTMQTITSYYTSWANMGQVISSRGGQMGATILAGSNAPSSGAFSELCSGATPSAGASILTCSGILFNTQATLAATNTAWDSTGASWQQVSNGMLVGDARVDNTADFIQPARNAWVQDISLYGEVIPGLNEPRVIPASTTYTSNGPGVSSVTASGGTAAVGSIYVDPSTGSAEVDLVLTSTTTGNFTYKDGLGVIAVPLTANVAFPSPDGQSLNSFGFPVFQVIPTVTVAPGGAGTFTTTLVWPNGSTSTLTVTVTGTVTPAQTVYYTPSGALSSTSAALNTVPASGVTALAQTNWLGVNFSPAKTAAWQWAFPYGKQPVASPLGQSFGSTTTSGDFGLLNGGQAPSNLIVYTGETSNFDVNSNTDFGIAPQIPNNANFSPGNTFPDSSLTAYSFVDFNTSPRPGYNPVIGPPSGSQGATNNAQYVMSNEWATNGGGGQACNIPGGVGSCTATPSPSYVNYMSTLNEAGGFAPANGATNNQTFYSPLTQSNSYSVEVSVGETGGKAEYSNENATVVSSPSFMSNGPQLQYMWPVLPLPASGAAAPCVLTTTLPSSAGPVCQTMFDQWQAGALGITTGPVSITAGGTQGTLTPTGNNTATALVVNSSSSPQTVTVYADTTSGDAQVGSLLSAGDSTGANSNGASISVCTSVNGALVCTVTVQPGGTVLSLPITGGSGAASYTNGTLVLGVAGTNMYSSSTTLIAPNPNGEAVTPGPVTGFTAQLDATSEMIDLTWVAPNAVANNYEFQLIDPSNNVYQYSSAAADGGSNPIVINSGQGQNTTASLPVPSGQSGIWRVQISAANSAGLGPSVNASVTIGNSIPVTPTGFQAQAQADGTVLLTWNPVSSQPALSNYSITAGPSTGVQSTFVTNLPSYTIQNVTATGMWNFSVTALNSVGSSGTAFTSLAVSGIVPTKPQNLQVDVDGQGWVSARFSASVSIPTADTYFVALYTPGATTPIASVSVPVSTDSETVVIRNFYQLASNAPTGTWTAVVTPTNSIGAGVFAQSSLFITPGLLSEVQGDLSALLIVGQIPAALNAFAKNACVAGTWTTGLSVFGTCSAGVFVPTPTAVN